MQFPRNVKHYLAFLFLIAAAPRTYATSSYHLFFDGFWKNSNLVASGSVIYLGKEVGDGWHYKKYQMHINKIYKGMAAPEIIFYNYDNSLSEPDRGYSGYRNHTKVDLKPGKDFLLFIRSITWRQDNVTTMGLEGLEMKPENLSEIEHAIQYCKDLDQAIDPGQRKAVLLKEAKEYNSFTSLSCDNAIGSNKLQEAIPIYLERLKKSNSYSHSFAIGMLFSLNHDRKDLGSRIETWLNEPNWNEYSDGEGLVLNLGCTFAPVIRKFTNSKDNLLAGCAQRAVIMCRKPDAKE